MSVTINVIGSDRQVTLDLPEPRENILHEVVRWQLARRRAGTARAKTRAEVTGSNAKIYPQKGTGRARHGNRKANIFVGGGTVFGPHQRDYSYTLPKRTRALGLAMALNARALDGKLTLVHDYGIENGKTKEFLSWAGNNGFDGSERVLLVTSNELCRRAARNLPWIGVLAPAGLNVYDILRYDHLILDADMIDDSDLHDHEHAHAGAEAGVNGEVAS